MSKSSRQIGFACLALVAIFAMGCGDQDTDRLARVGQKVVGKFEDMTGKADSKLINGLNAMRANLEELGIDARVTVRLRWDKSLAGVPIQVTATGSAVELKGTVSNIDQGRRAVELAQQTTGVERVTDSLTVKDQ